MSQRRYRAAVWAHVVAASFLGSAACGSGGTTSHAVDGGTVDGEEDDGGDADGAIGESVGDSRSPADGPGCATTANPGGCNCPNAGAPYTYTLPLSGDPVACGLSATASDNSTDVCSRLCGGCLSPIASAGKCQLTTAGGSSSVQCNAMCSPQ